jgi:glutamate dehydrogenase
MGITAKGAWESVRRHFRVVGIDVDATEITVVGIGDMSGDVFGNGMLLSDHLRLVAAFDHRHIFLDPDPDIVGAATERARLFALPQSSWDDYDRSLISEAAACGPGRPRRCRCPEQTRARLGWTPAPSPRPS